MNSTVTAKYQTTIPKAVREKLGITVNDAVEWIVEKGRVVVHPVHDQFLQYRGCVKVGAGDIAADIQSARENRADKFFVMKFIIDTNALISFVTDRNLAQQQIVAPIFEAASSMKCTIICHQFVLTEFVFVMERVYGTPKKTINAMLGDFITMPGVVLYQQTDFGVLLSFWPSHVADFGDALIAATAKALKGSIVVSFDQKFKSGLEKLGLQTL